MSLAKIVVLDRFGIFVNNFPSVGDKIHVFLKIFCLFLDPCVIFVVDLYKKSNVIYVFLFLRFAANFCQSLQSWTKLETS